MRKTIAVKWAIQYAQQLETPKGGKLYTVA